MLRSYIPPRDSYGSSTLRSLKLITSRLPTKIDIAASNLSSFDYYDNILLISSIDTPKLSKFCLTPLVPSKEFKELKIPHAIGLLASLPQLQSLSLFFVCPSQVSKTSFIRHHIRFQLQNLFCKF